MRKTIVLAALAIGLGVAAISGGDMTLITEEGPVVIPAGVAEKIVATLPADAAEKLMRAEKRQRRKSAEARLFAALDGIRADLELLTSEQLDRLVVDVESAAAVAEAVIKADKKARERERQGVNVTVVLSDTAKVK